MIDTNLYVAAWLGAFLACLVFARVAAEKLGALAANIEFDALFWPSGDRLWRDDNLDRVSEVVVSLTTPEKTGWEVVMDAREADWYEEQMRAGPGMTRYVCADGKAWRVKAIVEGAMTDSIGSLRVVMVEPCD